ncbi:MAG: radical SAM protein [Elusimicrobia bacterium]|nr:radical SAM protein [Elusimicrobiota bacterium]
MPDIPFWNKCNNKCVMCTNLGEFAAQPPSRYGLKRQIEKLERYLKGFGRIYLKNADKADFISLTGGEPTLHPDFFKLLAYFRKRLPETDISLLSNGRRFADKGFTERFLKIARPPFTVAVSIHGSSASAHDRVAGIKGAFSRTVKGLENLFAGLKGGGGAGVEIRLVLHRLNIGEFKKTLAFLLERFPAPEFYRVVAIHYEIEGLAFENHKRLALKLSASAGTVNATAGLIAKFPDFRLYHFPLCLVKKELRSKCRITLPAEDRIYPPKCAGCRARKKCPGLMLEYYKTQLFHQIKPIHTVSQSNTFTTLNLLTLSSLLSACRARIILLT